MVPAGPGAVCNPQPAAGGLTRTSIIYLPSLAYLTTCARSSSYDASQERDLIAVMRPLLVNSPLSMNVGTYAVHDAYT